MRTGRPPFDRSDALCGDRAGATALPRVGRCPALALSALVLVTVPAGGQHRPEGARDIGAKDAAAKEVAAKDYPARAAALIEPYLESGLFSGTVLVARDGRPVFRRAYGLANREWGVPNTLDTQFRIGSLTKSFTAAAILKLAEQGRLSLDDHVRRFVPGVPAAWDRITLRHLLGQTSGIINFTALPGYYDRLSRVEHTPRQILELVEGDPLLFEPGARVEYSNTNYVLLGMVIEAASGLPYGRSLREAILDPASLRETGYDEAGIILPRRAAGYRFGQGQWRNAPPLASSITYAAGGLHSTVDDLLAWDQALFAGKVISKASLDAMVDDGGRGYGFGWYVGRANERRVWSHGGSVSGFLAINDYYPDERVAVIVLANTETAPAQKIARELGALYYGILNPPEPIALDDAILERYAGTYRLGPRLFLTIARGDGRLIARGQGDRGTGEPPYALLPESDRTFFSKTVEARITFDTEPDGTPNGLILRREGRDRIAPRVDAETMRRVLAEPRPVRREIALSREKLGAFVGRYALGPGQIFTVSARDGRLYGQATGRFRQEGRQEIRQELRYELFPESERAVFAKNADLQVTFETNGNGRAAGLVLHADGLDTPAPRIEAPEAAIRQGSTRR